MSPKFGVGFGVGTTIGGQISGNGGQVVVAEKDVEEVIGWIDSVVDGRFDGSKDVKTG